MWVSYDEGLLNGRADMTTMKITAPTTSETTHPLYFDLIRLVEHISRQSRDKVVPTLDPDLYNPNNFWQQTYRWSQVSFVYLVFLWFKVPRLDFWGGGYLPSLSINYVGMSKDMEKRFPQLYYIKMKISYDLDFIAIGVAMAT